MCHFCSPLPATSEDVELLWGELVSQFGFDPTPQPSCRDEVLARIARVDPEYQAHALRIAELAGVITEDTLRPALAAAGVTNPEQYTAGFNSDRIIATTPNGYVVHDVPVRSRRPWVATENMSATQALPIVTVESI